jgi:hypothetical protein
LPLIYRRLLWQEYGVAIGDFTFEDMIIAIRLHSMEVERENNLSKAR